MSRAAGAVIRGCMAVPVCAPYMCPACMRHAAAASDAAILFLDVFWSDFKRHPGVAQEEWMRGDR